MFENPSIFSKPLYGGDPRSPKTAGRSHWTSPPSPTATLALVQGLPAAEVFNSSSLPTRRRKLLRYLSFCAPVFVQKSPLLQQPPVEDARQTLFHLFVTLLPVELADVPQLLDRIIVSP
jgi:hypothetical protein